MPMASLPRGYLAMTTPGKQPTTDERQGNGCVRRLHGARADGDVSHIHRVAAFVGYERPERRILPHACPFTRGASLCA